MKKILLSAIIAFLAINLGLYGQDTAQVEQKVKLELVYKKDFNELMVGAEGFPPPEIKQILKDKDIPQEDKDWLLNSLRIEIARRERVLYTNDGKAIKLPDDLQSISTSQNLKYMIVYAAHTDYGGLTADEVKKLREDWLDAYKRYSQWQTRYEKAEENTRRAFMDSMHYWLKISDSLNECIQEVTIRKKKEYKKFLFMETESGKILWEREDMPGWHYIADDGRLVIATGAGTFCNSAWYINEKGEVFKKVEFPSGFGRSGAMTSNGSWFYYLSHGAIVSAFNKMGEFIWRREIEGKLFTSGLLAISNNGYCVASVVIEGTARCKTYLLDRNGKIVSIFDYASYSESFSKDGRFLVMMNRGERGTFIEYVQVEEGRVLWHFDFSELKLWCSSVTLAPDGRFVAATARAGNKTYIVLFNNSGQCIQIIQTGNKRALLPIMFSPHGTIILSKIDNEYFIYRVMKRK